MKKFIMFLILFSSVFLFNKYLLNVNSYNIDEILSYSTLEDNVVDVNKLLKENSLKEINIKSLEEKINNEFSETLKGMKFYDRFKAFIYFNYIYKPIDYKEIDVDKYSDYINSLDKRDKESYFKILKKEIKTYERN